MLDKSRMNEIINSYIKKGYPSKLAEFEGVPEIKLLGFMFDDKLIFESHIVSVKQRVMSRINDLDITVMKF